MITQSVMFPGSIMVMQIYKVRSIHTNLFHTMILRIQGDSGKFHQHGHMETTLVQAHKCNSENSHPHKFRWDTLCYLNYDRISVTNGRRVIE